LDFSVLNRFANGAQIVYRNMIVMMCSDPRLPTPYALTKAARFLLFVNYHRVASLLAHVRFLLRYIKQSHQKFGNLLTYMSGNNRFAWWKNMLSLTAGTKSVWVGIFFFLGVSHLALSQSKPGLSENIKLYDQAVKSKEYKKAAQYATDVARIYTESKDLNKAADYFTHSLTQAKKAGDQNLLFAGYYQLGVTNAALKKYSKAQENFESALAIARQLKDAEKVKQTLISIADSYAQGEKYKKSIEYGDELLSIALTENDILLQQKAYQLLADYYNRQGNKKKSSEYLAQYNLLVKSQQNEEQKKREMKELQQNIAKAGDETRAAQSKLSEQTKILQQTNESLRQVESSLRATADSLKEVEMINKNREMEIDLLQKDKELASIRIKEQESRIEHEALVRNSIMGGSLLSLALIAVLISSYRKKLKANEKIDQQNKNIKSSINYAKRIQEAMLPKLDQHPGIFDHSFILFKPRDVVSGDFYWISDIKNEKHSDIAFAAVDCTGHGVPGAFMSMIGINALNGLINHGITDTNKILDSLDYEIRTALRQEITGNNDGMDVALCIYRQHEQILEFSGAKNPLVYIQDGNLVQIKGDVHSIGGVKNKHAFLFKKHQVKIDRPTVVYLFSDGYKDQFGGKDNGKFLSKRLHKLLLDIHHLSMPEQMNILQRTIEEWKGNREQTDDILVIGLKLQPA
jgi:serine phosphatase RsbU (regulator of sigma subunit)/tetratricopeptide (TPR) repeat protein